MRFVLLEKEILISFKEILQITDDVSIDIERDAFPVWDSIAHIQLIAEFENKFNINVPIEDVDKIKKLSDFLRYVKK